jgi:hypothetical protein
MMVCKHCGMPGHEKKDCQWAKASEKELSREVERRLRRLTIKKMETLRP